MSSQDAITALKRLGLSNYEARVFVALQELGSASARAISERSDVPRSQVYGAADDLVDRGLLEVTESSPKQYRPVSLSTARELLTERLEREREQAFDNLEELRTESSDQDGNHAVSTVRGQRPIDDRIVALVEAATESIGLVAPSTDSLTEQIEAALREQAKRGVAVTVVSGEESTAERFDDSEIRVVVMDEDNPADFAGRALMVDDDTILLSVATADDGVGEEAMWTARSSIGRILAQFMQSGIKSGLDRNGPP